MSGGGDENSQPARPRRASFVELFAARPTIDSGSATSKPHASSMAAAVTQQAQQQSSRRLSITTLGLSASPTNNQPGPFGSLRRGSAAPGAGRRGSIDMSESAVDGEEPGPLMSPGQPAGRRLSFGAKAYRDLRTSGGTSAISEATAAGQGPKKASPSSAKANDGFNWGENLRAKAKRSSVSATPAPSGSIPVLSPTHNRTTSTASSQASLSPPPPKPVQKAPDHFQERILKGMGHQGTDQTDHQP